MPKRYWLVAALLALSVASDVDASPVYTSGENNTDAYSQEPPPEQGKSKKKKSKQRFRFGGRLFTRHQAIRSTLGDTAAWRNKTEVSSARLSVKVKATDGVRGELKVEFEDKGAEVKEAHLDFVSGSGLDFSAGFFKRPSSLIWLSGRWDLPMVERGILNEKLEGQELAFVGGRGTGFLGSYVVPVAIEWQVDAAVMQGEHSDNVDSRDGLGQDFYLRNTVEPFKDFRVALGLVRQSYQRDLAIPASYDQALTASLEAAYEGRHFQAWVEGYWGQSRFGQIGSPAKGNSLAGRLLVAPIVRLPGPYKLIPFVALGAIDPSLSRSEDGTGQVQVGLTLTFKKFWRAQIEVSRQQNQGDSAYLVENTSVFGQLGFRFKE